MAHQQGPSYTGPARARPRRLPLWSTAAIGLASVLLAAHLGVTGASRATQSAGVALAAPDSAWTTLHLPFLGRQHRPIPALDFVGMVGATGWAIAAEGTIVYVVDGPHVVVLDTANSSAPVELGRTPALPGQPLDIALDTERRVAAVAAASAGVVTLDLTRPGAPRLMGMTASGAITDARAIALHGGVAVVAAGVQGVATVDLSTPEAPRRLALLDLGAPIGAIAAADGLALTGAARTGEEPPDSFIGGPVLIPEHRRPAIVALSEPASPRLMARLPVSSSVRDVAMVGRRAFVAGVRGRACPGGSGCLAAFDLAEPESPRGLELPAGAVGDRLVEDPAGQLIAARNATTPALVVLDAAAKPAPTMLEVGAAPAGSGPLALGGGRAYLLQTLVPLGMLVLQENLALSPWPWPAPTRLDIVELALGGSSELVGTWSMGPGYLRQLVRFGDEVLALQVENPVGLGWRNTVWRIDPRAPARRNMEWGLIESDWLHVHEASGTLFALRLDAERALLRAMDLTQPGAARPIDELSLMLPGESAGARIRSEGDRLWLAFASGASPLEPTGHTMIEVHWTADGALIPGRSFEAGPSLADFAVLGDRVLLAQAPSLLLVTPSSGAVPPRVEQELPWSGASKVRLVEVEGCIFVSDTQLHVLELQGGRLDHTLSVPLGVERGMRPLQSPVALDVERGMLAAVAREGVRLFDVRDCRPRLVGAARMPPPIAADLARWPQYRQANEAWVHGDVALAGSRVVTGLHLHNGIDEPVSPVGLTAWRVPGR